MHSLKRHRLQLHTLQLVLAVLASTLTTMPVPGVEVFLCRLPDQAVLYSQFPCPTGAIGADEAGGQQTLHLEPLQTLQVPPLHETERRRLAALGQRTERQQQRRLAQRTSRMRDLGRDRQRRLARCSTARRQLEELAAIRRKGYTAGEARHLAARERALDAALAANC